MERLKWIGFANTIKGSKIYTQFFNKSKIERLFFEPFWY
jgi:hypothetical protein